MKIPIETHVPIETFCLCICALCIIAVCASLAIVYKPYKQ